jgi:signal peptidase I
MRLAEGSFLALSRGILAQGYELQCRTLGSSMFPLIQSRSLIRVQPVEPGHLRPGDVILYQSGAGLVAHRLIKKEPGPARMVLVTRGDAFPWGATARIDPEQVLGRVVSIEWRRGLKVRIDQGPGRRLGILVARIAPFLLPIYLVLSKIKQALSTPRRP